MTNSNEKLQKLWEAAFLITSQVTVVPKSEFLTIRLQSLIFVVLQLNSFTSQPSVTIKIDSNCIILYYINSVHTFFDCCVHFRKTEL
jgi:hypothetical protein